MDVTKCLPSCGPLCHDQQCPRMKPPAHCLPTCLHSTPAGAVPGEEAGLLAIDPPIHDPQCPAHHRNAIPVGLVARAARVLEFCRVCAAGLEIEFYRLDAEEQDDVLTAGLVLGVLLWALVWALVKVSR